MTGAPEIREAWRELHAVACAMRGDWDPAVTQARMLAAKQAGTPFETVLAEIVRQAGLPGELDLSDPEDADGGEPGPRKAERELIAFACATRPDWTQQETWAAVYAARTAGLDWARLAARLVDIAFREEETPTRPRELWDDVRGLRNLPGTGVPLDPDVKARLLEELKSKTAPAVPRQAEAPATETETNGGTE